MIIVNYYLKGAISETNLKIRVKTKDSSHSELLRKPLQLYIMISGLGKRVQLYTQKRISQYEWDKKKQQIDTRKNKVNGEEINDWLQRLKHAVIKQDSLNENSGKITTSHDILKIMLSITPGAKTNNNFTFQNYYDRFISEHKTGEGHSKKSSTVRKYNSFYSHLKNYAEKKRIRLHISNIDLNFLNDFKDYLVTDKKLGDNTVSKYIKAAKTFIRFYTNEGLIKPFALTEVKCGEKKGEIYIISIRQLIQLQNFEIKNERLSQCRDIFCFQCWTGQRYSDIMAIRKEDIKTNENGEKTWDLFTIKTGDNIKVPIVEYADYILKKYENGTIPLPLISMQKQNDYLKELGKLISLETEEQKKLDGFDTKTKVVEFHDGVRKESYVPFYDVLTTHVARKTYITNSLMIGVPERVVKEVSGHKSEKDFRRYVNLASTYKDEMIRKSYSNENINKFL